jgi:hypothetical protein
MHVHGKYSMNAMALSLSIVKRASPETGNARKLRNLGIAVGHATQTQPACNHQMSNANHQSLAIIRLL